MKKDIRRENNWYNYCHKNIFIENLYGHDIPALEDVDVEYMDINAVIKAVNSGNSQAHDS